jgi:hypothetical protein
MIAVLALLAGLFAYYWRTVVFLAAALLYTAWHRLIG